MDILISIQPEWWEKIETGEKTAEIRKTKPGCRIPFTAYIYCTKPVGAVVAKFTCESIEQLKNLSPDEPMYHFPHNGAGCLTRTEMEAYGKGKPLYSWRITNLEIFKKPRPLSDFWCRKPLKHPPQSWCYCYAEEIKKTCKFCAWRSDTYTSVCCNDASDHCADYVMESDSCPVWKLAARR